MSDTPTAYERDYQSSPEERLYRAIFAQAIKDASGIGVASGTGGKKDASDRITQDARDWLTNNSPDFRTVCAIGDIDPNTARTKATEFVASLPPVGTKPTQSSYHDLIPDHAKRKAQHSKSARAEAARLKRASETPQQRQARLNKRNAYEARKKAA